MIVRARNFFSKIFKKPIAIDRDWFRTSDLNDSAVFMRKKTRKNNRVQIVAKTCVQKCVDQ